MNRFLVRFIIVSCLVYLPIVSFAQPHQTNSAKNNYQNALYRLEAGRSLPDIIFEISQPGSLDQIRYEDYGKFEKVGTSEFQYVVNDKKALSQSMCAGVYPNIENVYAEPDYQDFKEKGLLDTNHWTVLSSDNLQAAFYTWATAPEEPGVKTFFTAKVLERAGHIQQAIKAYHSCIVFFPRSVGWGKDGSFVWYIAPAAIANIQRLCREYPQLGLDFVEANVIVQNGDDTNLDNDVVSVKPGRFVKRTLEQKFKRYPDLSSQKIIEKRGGDRIQVVKYKNGQWQLLVEGAPYMVRGVTYSPTQIGLGPYEDANFSSRWMFTDTNENGVIDAPYESWVDKNNNGQQDGDEPAIGDFQLLKNMGVNTIRLYVETPGTEYNPAVINKPLLRDLYETYGIRVIIGNFLGAYLQGSGANWETGTDYTDAVQKENMKKVVRDMVMDLKDEPFVLMWLLGNENNMPVSYFGVNATRTNASQRPRAYAEFLNEISKMIHSIDGQHPVAVGNIERGLIAYYQRYAPQLDVLGVNSYRGGDGFDSLWAEVKTRFDRPILITEFGHDAYHHGLGVQEDLQLSYHEACIKDITFNLGGGRFYGNSIGGVVFEFLDEWWKNSSQDSGNKHSTESRVYLPFSDGISHEEWMGIVSQGSGENSPFERRLRKTYFFYKDLWN